MDELVKAINTGNKLTLIIGKPGSGKSKIIHKYSENSGIPIVDFSKLIAGNHADIKKIMSDFLKNYRFDVLLLDNKKDFYKASNGTDLMELLKDLSEEVAVVATWNGFIEDGQLTHIVNGQENIYPVDGSYKYIIV
ncbi:BREX-3 system P-loop-containing protein BrxF [Sharpea porci]|nr:BREX-3 system P-loop-containing protein BrxF [Sharpea porci]MDY5279621.1 BREX-3 system P-loop-containing protein BrxF [Sharpea porci]